MERKRINEKTMKVISFHAKCLLREWLYTLVPDPEEVPLNKVKSYLSPDTHYWAGGRVVLSGYSYKWTTKGLKKLYREEPAKHISEWRTEDIERIHRATR